MLERLDRLTVSEQIAARLGGAGDVLTLRRAWARSATHLLLEYVGQGHAIVPGQWMDDAAELDRVAHATGERSPGWPPIPVAAAGVLLQPGGGDRKLRGLPALLREPGAILLSHRPERRAVVQRPGRRFTKVVRRGRAEGIVAGLQTLAGALDPACCRVPVVLESELARGHVTCAALAGRSMDDLLDESGRGPAAARAAGTALRHLHEADVDAPDHDAAQEQRLLAEQIERLEVFAPGAAARCRSALAPVAKRLAETPGAPAVLHRDFYDKQIFFDERAGPGLLDFDTLAWGEAALDLGNMLAHLELRVLQGRCRPPMGVVAGEAFLDSYGPDAAVLNRVQAYVDASRLRLACLYAYRPPWRHLTDPLLDRLGAPALAPSAGRA